MLLTPILTFLHVLVQLWHVPHVRWHTVLFDCVTDLVIFLSEMNYYWTLYWIYNSVINNMTFFRCNIMRYWEVIISSYNKYYCWCNIHGWISTLDDLWMTDETICKTPCPVYDSIKFIFFRRLIIPNLLMFQKIHIFKTFFKTAEI